MTSAMTADAKAIPDFDLSPTSIKKIVGCPGQYAFRYGFGLPEESGLAAAIGTVAHEALAAATYRRLREQTSGKITAKELVELCQGDGPAYVGAREKLGAVEDFSVDDAQHVEQWWTFEVDGITAGGIWDRVDLRDGKVIVIDYKTGARKPMAMDPQTLLYLAAAHDLWPELEVKLEFWWLKTGRKSSETWTPRLDFIARELIKAAWAIVEAQDFRQEIGSACRFCNFKGMCGVWQEFEQGKAWLVKPGFGAK